MKLNPVPKEVLSVGMGSNSREGKGYFIDWDKSTGKYIMLGFSKPDTCAIYVQGIAYNQVKMKLHENYKLALAFRDDVGLQITEMHVPGGTKGNDMKEASKLGFISVTFPKPEVTQDGFFTLAFMPPETVSTQFK